MPTFMGNKPIHECMMKMLFNQQQSVVEQGPAWDKEEPMVIRESNPGSRPPSHAGRMQDLHLGIGCERSRNEDWTPRQPNQCERHEVYDSDESP